MPIGPADNRAYRAGRLDQGSLSGLGKPRKAPNCDQHVGAAAASRNGVVFG
jgi:hypothetical protein